MSEPSDNERLISRLEKSHNRLRDQFKEDLQATEGRLREYIGSVSEKMDRESKDLRDKDYKIARDLEDVRVEYAEKWGKVVATSAIVGGIVAGVIKYIPEFI